MAMLFFSHKSIAKNNQLDIQKYYIKTVANYCIVILFNFKIVCNKYSWHFNLKCRKLFKKRKNFHYYCFEY